MRGASHPSMTGMFYHQVVVFFIPLKNTVGKSWYKQKRKIVTSKLKQVTQWIWPSISWRSIGPWVVSDAALCLDGLSPASTSIAPFHSRMSKFGANAYACLCIALIWLVGILPFRGKFKFWQQRKKRAYVHCSRLIGWHPRPSAANALVLAIRNFARGNCYRWWTCLSWMHAHSSPPLANLYVSHMYAVQCCQFNLIHREKIDFY